MIFHATKCMKQENFHKNVKRIRSENHLTQFGLAEKSGVSRRFIQDIESGGKSPTIGVVCKLKDGLDCTWSELFRGM